RSRRGFDAGLTAVDRHAEPDRGARTAGSRGAAPAGDGCPARDAANGRLDARHSGMLVSRDREEAEAPRGDGQGPHQQGANGARAANQKAARRTIQSDGTSSSRWSALMNLTTDQTGGVSIVRVGEPRLMYPILGDFSSAVTTLVAGGKRNILIDLAPVTYV